MVYDRKHNEQEVNEERGDLAHGKQKRKVLRLSVSIDLFSKASTHVICHSQKRAGAETRIDIYSCNLLLA